MRILKTFGRVYVAAGRIFDADTPSGYRHISAYRHEMYGLNIGRWGIHVSIFSREPIV